jgi:hypothetical protein
MNHISWYDSFLSKQDQITLKREMTVQLEKTAIGVDRSSGRVILGTDSSRCETQVEEGKRHHLEIR